MITGTGSFFQPHSWGWKNGRLYWLMWVVKDLATAKPSDRKARQMKKLIEQSVRLQEKGKGRRS